MSAFKFTYDWVDLGSDSDHRCIQVTFAQLSIFIGDKAVTRLVDRRARTTRDFVVTPLYPLAEWIVANWWAFFEEPEAPSRGTTRTDYRGRHAFRTGREGYVLPEVEFFPEGETTRVVWRPHESAYQPVEFLEAGFNRVATAELRQAMTDLVETVISRLDAHQMSDTWLHEEWQAVQQMDPDEREFCLAAGRLGIDPFSIDDALGAAIQASASVLPSSLRDDVFRSAPPDQLTASVEWVTKGVEKLGAGHPFNGRGATLRQDSAAFSSAALPWESGYRAARELRRMLDSEDVLRIDLDAIVGSPIPIILASPPPARSFEGIVGTNDSGICCYTAKHHRPSQRFLCARGLLGILVDSTSQPQLFSSAQTTHQQRSRAFAAELLAPSNLLRPKLSGDEISDDEVEDLAATFNVSNYVIEHQIHNHGLGRVVASNPG